MKTFLMDAQIATSKELITPAVAEKILMHPATQRSLSEDVASSYANSMRSGEWCFDTGETIVLNKAGGCIQGQHRLNALIAAGIAAEFLVVRNAPDNSFNYMDQGRARTAGDIFKLNGYPYPALFSAFARRLMEFDRKTCTFKSLGRVNNHAVLMFAKPRVERMERELRAAESKAHELTPSLAAAVFYLIRAIDEDKAQSFIGDLLSTDRVKWGRPASALNTHLSAFRRGTKNGLAYRDQLPYVIYAWNHHFDGRELTRWRLPDHQRFLGAPTPDYASWETWI